MKNVYTEMISFSDKIRDFKIKLKDLSIKNHFFGGLNGKTNEFVDLVWVEVVSVWFPNKCI